MTSSSSASRTLLAAALGGLLCATACSSSYPGSSQAGVTGDSGTGSDAQPLPFCPNPAVNPTITSSQVVADMTLEKFTADCDAKGGTVETHAECGGHNTCRGMSYDTGTQTLTEHTCKYQNACAGYSCVIC